MFKRGRVVSIIIVCLFTLNFFNNEVYDDFDIWYYFTVLTCKIADFPTAINRRLGIEADSVDWVHV